MTVQTMILISRIFLGLMILFLILAIILFFLLDIKKAWKIVIGTRIFVVSGKNKQKGEILKNLSTKYLMESQEKDKEKQSELEQLTALLSMQEGEHAQCDEVDVTTVLANNIENETTLLTQLSDVNDTLEILMDETNIHTNIIV